MTTTVSFDIFSDEPDLTELVTSINNDAVLKWKLAVFCCQMQLEKVLKAEAVREHYDTIHMRARATRAAKKTP